VNQEWDLQHLFQSPRAQQDLINKVLTEGGSLSYWTRARAHTHTFALSHAQRERERERESMGI